MRIDAAAAALAVAVAFAVAGGCGGAPRPPPEDACRAYDRAVRAPLGRIGRAADTFADALGRGPDEAVRGSRGFARALDDEHAALAAVRPGRADVGDAHAGMLAALAGLADAIRFLGDVVAARDERRREEARRRLADAEAAWDRAATRVKRVCPEAALP